MEKILLFIVLLVAVIGGAGYWFLSSGSINEIIKEQIQTQGHKATGQRVRVNTVDIHLLEGAGSIRGLTVANPSGYKQPLAFSLGNIAVNIEVASLTEEPYVIESILISEPQVFVEIGPQGSNLQGLHKAIEKQMPTDIGDAQSKGPSFDPKIKINSLTMSGVAMTLDLTALGNKVHSETLSPIKLESIGGSNGLPASQLGAALAKEITKALQTEAKKKQKEKLKNKLKEKASRELFKLFGKLNKD